MTDRIRATLLVALCLVASSGCGPVGSAEESRSSGVIVAPGNSADPGAGEETTGSINAQFTLPGGERLDTVSWTVTCGGAGGVVQHGQVDVTNSLAATFLVANLPPATGYRMALAATASSGRVTCAGSAHFDVAPGMTTSLSVPMACNVATAAAPALPTWAVVLLGLSLMAFGSPMARRRLLGGRARSSA
jgi:hypothetical protein